MGARTNLKLFRVKHKLTQQDMADRMGYSRATYAAVEAGTRDCRTTFWNKLSEAFAIPASEVAELMRNDDVE